MTRILRRVIVAVVALVSVAASAIAIPAGAAGSPDAHTAWARYVFHGKGSGFLQVTGRVEAAPGAFFALVTEFRDPHAPPQAPFADVLDLDSLSQAGTYGAAGNRDLCPGLATCIAENGGLGFTVSFGVGGDGRHVQDVRQYIVARGAHVVVRDQMRIGWTATHRAGGVTRRTVSDATGAGAVALGQTVGAELGVSAPGPAGGSIAIAVPGCEQAGAGVLTLTGGVTEETTICPTDNIAGVAEKATTWNASGAVGGWSNNTSRLIVLRS